MSEIKFLFHRLIKYWFFLILILLYQFWPLVLFVWSQSSEQNDNLAYLKLFFIYKNFDVIFFGITFVPFVFRALWKNVSTDNNSNKMSIFKIVFYIFLIMLTYTLLKLLWYYLLDLALNTSYSTPNSSISLFKPDFGLTIFAEVSLVVSSILVGLVISFFRVKKWYNFVSFISITTIVILAIYGFFGLVFLLKDPTKVSADYIPRWAWNVIYPIKSILFVAPLSAYFVMVSISATGLGFSDFLNYDTALKKLPNGITENTELSHTIAIFIIVFVVVYIAIMLFVVLLHHLSFLKYWKKLYGGETIKLPL